MTKQNLLEKFKEIYGPQGEPRVFFAPGRVNLIGEHTDYNGGHVFPCALQMGTTGVIRRRDDRKLRFFSLNMAEDGLIESSLDNFRPLEGDSWTNYPMGVVWALIKEGKKIEQGFDLLIYGNIPNGSGLSSSASLEVLVGTIMKEVYALTDLSPIDIAKIGQYSENNYNGCNCGIMDQFAVAMGKKDCGIFLDTANLEYEYAPIRLEDAKIVIVNSKVKHSLVDSAYNDRRRECEEAVVALNRVCHIEKLGELSEAEFESHKGVIKSKVVCRRAKHAVYENQRTIKALEALKKNDLTKFGKLMNQSHDSLRDDYEVSCQELDTLVDLAQSVEGVIGSRMTGGGFGGCTVSIVKDEAIDQFKEVILNGYKEATGKTAEIYIASIGDGAREI